MENGYCAIGIYQPKSHENVGTLWRSALIFQCAYTFLIGQKFLKQASDVFETHKQQPFFYYEHWEDFKQHLPYNCRLVGVENQHQAIPIEEYTHFERCVYVLGSEHSGLPKIYQSQCHEIIQLPLGNFNVAVAGSLVLYDRHLKRNQLKV